MVATLVLLAVGHIADLAWTLTEFPGIYSRPSSHPPSTNLSGTLQTLAGVEAVWQMPSSPPLGLVLLTHGCGHSATDFWPPSPSCPRCIGLPEEVAITSALLEES